MSTTIAIAPAAVNRSPASTTTRSGFTITSWPSIEFYPERDILDTEAASFAAWQAEEDADADLWSDAYADEMAERAEMGAMVETTLRF